jgi:hypothetical protein
MKRKTSTVPTCVYKYRLYDPIDAKEARAADDAFRQARVHYNKLITIERRRREEYRKVRAQLFPELGALEVQQKEYEARIKSLREEVQAEKIRTRSRTVAPEKKKAVADLIAEKKEHLKKVRALRAVTRKSIILCMEGDLIDERAHVEIRAMRPEIYWGTYLLVEAAARQAKSAKKDPDYNLIPPHRLSNRIGVHFQGGLAAKDANESSIMRITPVRFRLNRHDEEIAKGKDARTTLQFRIGPGSGSDEDPIWITLPMIQHRPLPSDARIKDAYITRRRYSVRVPWQYHLCVVMDAPSYQRTTSSAEQKGTATINFGWRSTKQGLRIAMINREGQETEEILLPPSYIGLEYKRRNLTRTLAGNFNRAKTRLSSWMQQHSHPEGFKESFTALPQWRSQHRFAELMDYWQEHRFPGDEEIFAALAAREDPGARRGARPWSREDIERASWMVRYRHLQTWLDSVQRKLGNWRDYYYRCLAKRLATTTACLCIEDFDMRKIAERPSPEEPEDQGDERARSNRQLASISDLRNKILEAAAKYHCRVVDVPAKNNTRRCDVCGELHPWEPKKKIDHVCANPHCGAEWDQDVNNTDRQHTRIASGEVTTLVAPAEHHESIGFVQANRRTFSAARKELDNLLKTE